MAEQSNAAAERSAHVTRGEPKPEAGEDPFVGPFYGPVKLRAVQEAREAGRREGLEEALRVARDLQSFLVYERIADLLKQPSSPA